MSERLTKEREAEVRRVVDKMGFHPTPGLVRDLLAEIDALRDTLRDREAQRMVAIAMAQRPTTYLHADGTEEPVGELVARLTRERDEARSDHATAETVLAHARAALEAATQRDRSRLSDVDHVAADRDAWATRATEAEADLAEARRAFLMCAEAVGVVYEAEGRNAQPGPPDAVVSAILADARRADEAEDRVRELESELAKR